MAAGGGSIAGSMQEGEGEQQAQSQIEQGPQQELLQVQQEKETGVPAGGPVVLPVSPGAHQQTMKVR
jgi:hypothetical protein